MESITLRNVVTSFIESIDMVNYLLKNHHRRVAVIAYQLGFAYGLSPKQLQNLVLAASLHDVGALTVAERDKLIQMDIENPHPHAILGSLMLTPFYYFEDISKIVRFHHVYWNDGYAIGTNANEVPIESYLLHLADRIDILIDPTLWILDQIEIIKDQVINLKGSIFHPDAVKAFVSLSSVDSFWLDIDNLSMAHLLDFVFQNEEPVPMNLDLLEDLALTLSKIIDFRSEFTATHSCGVAVVAYEIGRLYGLETNRCRELRIAGYLHDIGKIAIPTEIIDKPTRLSTSEYNQIKAHAYYTRLILEKIKGLEEICNWASMHHEKRDGTGYPSHLGGTEFSIESDIIAYADVFTALTENRPYRNTRDAESILRTIGDDYVPGLGETIYTLIEKHFDELNAIRDIAQTKAFSDYQHALFNVKVGL